MKKKVTPVSAKSINIGKTFLSTKSVEIAIFFFQAKLQKEKARLQQENEKWQWQWELTLSIKAILTTTNELPKKESKQSSEEH